MTLVAASVFWLGGGSGAGKTTIARAVAGRLDLRLYHVDAVGYDHARRMSHGPFPHSQAWNAFTYDERWLRSPEVLADDFRAISRERMPLIIEDLTALGSGATIIAEGPQLLPALVAPLIDKPEAALWLLPTAEFARRGVAARGEVVPSSEEAEATENRYRRDVLLTQLLRDQSDSRGLPCVSVDGRRSLSEMTDWLASLLVAMPHVVRAETGEQRASMRRQENAVIAKQLTAYWRDMGSEVMPEAPAGPFSCECCTLGCDREVTLPVDEYLARDQPLTTHAD